MLILIFMVLAHWNNRSEVYMSLHSDTLSWLPPPISPAVMIWMKCDEKRLIIHPQLTSELPGFLVWFGLWCLTPLSTIFHIMLYWEHLVWAWFELTTLVAIGTDCIGSYKSNYHKIMTMTTPDDGERSWLVNHVKEMLHFTASSVTHDWWCSDALQLSPVAVQMFEIQELSWVKDHGPYLGV